MAVTTNSIARASTELLIPKKWNHRETSPERNIIWIEPKPNKALKNVPVIYYLSRNGQLEHPHFIEVPFSSSDGLYLKDVINRLNFLRGKGMAYLFSWSCKRSYKNGYVWHDLLENDLIHPTNGHDYVLKGSELLETSMSSRFCEISLPESQKSHSNSDENGDSSSSTMARRRRNQSWSSFENPRQEYRLVYKCESSREIAGKLMSAAAVDTARQTEEKRRKGEIVREQENKSVELNREELSPPPSMSSSDGVDGGRGSKVVNVGDQTAENEFSSGRMSASRVVMQLITCGSSTSVDCSIGPAITRSGLKMLWTTEAPTRRETTTTTVDQAIDGVPDSPRSSELPDMPSLPGYTLYPIQIPYNIILEELRKIMEEIAFIFSHMII
ncbi:hypothetical protein RND71_008944 [Anisodus tanguticus]|uniref:SOSEKI DIX-like domain-containing protein n=1 Tax=Anisodus tanguticus TaxID=243964 RepID=A0AAE1SP88_9SOLA|nr:hypothetical protein RND71_008944 [Anisodus tanguticus]